MSLCRLWGMEKLEKRPQNETGSSHINCMNNREEEFFSSPSSFLSNGWKYDVFLSFRGEDTRRHFTDHLYAALVRKGINTFRDDKKLDRGESITAEISEAIQQSRSSLIVFSRNYAFSNWCMEELVQIIECKHRRGHQIFPIFYDVDPSAVRKQTGSFRKAFDKHRWAFWKDKSKLQEWRSALVHVANISGWNAKDRLESELIEEVARVIAVKLRPTPPSYKSVSELAEIDRCLETLSSYVTSTIFLHAKCRCKDQASYSAEVGGDKNFHQTMHCSVGEKQALCSSEEDIDCIRQQYQEIEEHVMQLKNGLLKKYPLQSLLQGTDHFSQSLIIGTGGFGSIYLARLEDGSNVAIKRARTHCKYKDVEFLQEIGCLSRINHKNIIWLSGFYMDHVERILVYEHLEHGSLFDHLFVLPNSPLKSSWAARLKAAVDTARGIEYLHEYAVPPIIHRDVKSSNILFDSRWMAKVIDFGLSLVAPESDGVYCDVCGTAGYLDPEYYTLQRVTMKSDVYSFGVVLLELLSGQKARGCPFDGHEASAVVDAVVPKIVGRKIQDILDQTVTPPTSSEMEAMRSVGELAVDCVNPLGRFRPSMVEVVKCLVKVSNEIV